MRALVHSKMKIDQYGEGACSTGLPVEVIDEGVPQLKWDV
jgi:hypothetical protein